VGMVTGMRMGWGLWMRNIVIDIEHWLSNMWEGLSAIQLVLLLIELDIHQFFLDVKVMRLTATEPPGGTDLMDTDGMGELVTGPVDNLLLKE